MNLNDVLDRCSKTAAWNGQSVLSLDQKNDFDDTPLHTVCSWGEVEPVEILLANGADIKARGDKGNSVLFNAINAGNLAVIQILLKRGVDPSVKNDWGRTPLQYALNVAAHKAIINLLQKFK